MNLGDQLKRIRRFLRDPTASIWGRSFLINLFNDAQKEMQIKTGFLEDVSVLPVPPSYQWSYQYDWETGYLDGTKHHQALQFHEQGDFSFCHIFEPQIDFYGLSSDASDWGAHFTHPWEAWSNLGSGELVKIPFPKNFHAVQFMAYDRKPMDAIRRKDVTNTDTDYVNHTGEPRWYWREDDLDNSFIPYPRPSTVVWNDVVEQKNYGIVYTFDWEFTQLGVDDHFAANWTRTDSTNEREYIYRWEKDPGLDDFGIRGMFLFEADFSLGGHAILYADGDTTDVFGTFNVRTGSIFSQEEGIAVQVLDDVSNFLLVYDVNPDDLAFDADVSEFPQFLRKYIEHKVISRAYGANTDGRIQSLSDYWNYRYETGMQLVKRFMSKRKEDRDYRLTTGIEPRRSSRHPRLPSTYPAI